MGQVVVWFVQWLWDVPELVDVLDFHWFGLVDLILNLD